MMRGRLLALAEQRARLSARAQSERVTINSLVAPADAAASLAQSLFAIARSVQAQAQRYPFAAAAIIALLVGLRPKRAMIWLSRGWSLWRLYRGARGWWLRFQSMDAAAGTPKRSW
jgi:hypothetical protein